MNNFRLLPAALVLALGLTSSLAGTLLRFHTTIGDIDVELYDNDKPITVQNFLTYVEGGYFNNMFMHRVVPNFVIQGGGFNAAGLNTFSPYVTNVITLPPITNEFNVGPFYSNLYGTIAMAKTSDPNSATSQFFFNLTNNASSLDVTTNSGGFTVFGHVVGGTNVLNEFLVGGTNQIVQEVNAGGTFSELPVLYATNRNSVSFADLVYVDIGPAYIPLKAAYTGLCAPPPSVAGGVPGLITLTTTTASKLSGSLRLGPTRYTFTGTFDTAGHAYVLAKSGRLEPLLLSLRTDLVQGSDKLLGTVSSTNGWTADVVAYRAAFDGFTRQATAYAGKYTVAVTNSATGGTGVAALNVTLAGRVSVSAALADGTAFSQTVALSSDGHCALYAPLNGGHGSFSAWLSFTNGADTDVNGTGLWYKPAAGTGKAYLGGFTNNTALMGWRYMPPNGGTPVLSQTNYQIAFSGGALATPFTNALMLKGTRLMNTTTNKVTISLAAATGLFSGSFKPPGSQVSYTYKGALFQPQDGGLGYFLGAGVSGQVRLGENE